jgi:DNA-binding IclR family transcriptional regulator
VVLRDVYPLYGSLSTSAARKRSSRIRHGDRNRDAPKTSIEKALAVLSAFNGPVRSRGLSELARELNLPRPTLHRILKQLSDWGFVARLPSNRYQVGLKLFELGTLVYHHMQLRNAAAPHLHSLYHQTKCSVYLTILAGDEVLHLDCIPGRDKPAIPARAGGRWSVHCSSVGKVLLAAAPKPQLDAYLGRPLKPLTKYSIRDPKALAKHLEEVRKAGYAVTDEESLIGVYGVAAAIRDHRGEAVAAICIASGNRATLRLHEQVRHAAEKISHDLAHGR